MSDTYGVLSVTDSMDSVELVEAALRLEAFGYAALWLPELMGREPFTTASFLLARTERLRIATGIANVYSRDATSTAQASRTLAELSHGRFVLGLGVSHPSMVEPRGHEWIAPVTKMRAYLEAVSAAKIRSPEPSQPAPVYIAAHGPGLLRVAAELADGANTYLMPIRHTTQARAILGSQKALNIALPCCLSSDAVEARRVSRRALSFYVGLPAYHRQWLTLGYEQGDFENGGSDRLIDDLVAWGDEAQIRERIAAHMDAGATQIQLITYNPEGGATLHWKLLEALVSG